MRHRAAKAAWPPQVAQLAAPHTAVARYDLFEPYRADHFDAPADLLQEAHVTTGHAFIHAQIASDALDAASQTPMNVGRKRSPFCG